MMEAETIEEEAARMVARLLKDDDGLRTLREVAERERRALARAESEFQTMLREAVAPFHKAVAGLNEAVDIEREMNIVNREIKEILGAVDESGETLLSVEGSRILLDIAIAERNIGLTITTMEDLGGVSEAVAYAQGCCERYVKSPGALEIKELSHDMTAAYNYFALQALAFATAQTSPLSDSSSSDHTMAVRRMEKEMETVETCWDGYAEILLTPIYSCFDVAYNEPQLLVAVARALEMQEKVQERARKQFEDDDEIEEANQFLSESVVRALEVGGAGSFRRRALSALENAVDIRCDGVYGFKSAMEFMRGEATSLAKENSTEANTELNNTSPEVDELTTTLSLDDDESSADTSKLSAEFVASLLEKALLIRQDLVFVNEYITICFPPYYQVDVLMSRKYHENITKLMACLTASGETLSNREIITLLDWSENYTIQLAAIVENSSDALVPSMRDVVRPLIDVYCSRSRTIMGQWSRNILQREVEKLPTQYGTKWYSPGAVDLFQIVEAQISTVLVDDAIVGWLQASLLGPLVEDCGNVLRRYAENQLPIIKKLGLERADLCLERLSAMANNNLRSMKDTVELAEQVTDILETHLHLDEAGDSFIATAKAAIVAMSDIMFVDISKELNRLVGAESAEDAEGVVLTILATFKDYFDDFSIWLEKSLFRLLVQEIIDRFVVEFATTILSTSNLNVEVTSSISDLTSDTFDFFMDLGVVKEQRIIKSYEALNAIAALMKSPLQKISSTYVSLREELGTVPVIIVERLANNTRKEEFASSGPEVSAVLQECRALAIDDEGDQEVQDAESIDIFGRLKEKLSKQGGGWSTLRRRKTTINAIGQMNTPKTPRKKERKETA